MKSKNQKNLGLVDQQRGPESKRESFESRSDRLHYYQRKKKGIQGVNSDKKFKSKLA